MTRCQRCPWVADPDGETSPREQLVAHAQDSAHWLCSVCARSLTDYEPAVCEACLTDARALLSGIVVLFAELPRHLGHLNGSLRPQTGRSDDGSPLPGGEALVMLSDGSEGLSEDASTSRDADPPSVAFELGWWAMAAMDDRDEAEELGQRPLTVVHRAAGYLERHARWLAVNSPGFAQLHADLARLHARLERATARDLPTQRANAACFDCGGTLILTLRTVTVVDEATGRRWEGPVHDERDGVTCRACKRAYTPAEYGLALRAAWEDAQAWVTLTQAAAQAKVSFRTVQTWANRGQVGIDDSTGHRLVWWPDVRTVKAEAEKRRQEREAAKAEAEQRRRAS